jgi:hypothetical protein
VVRQCLAISTPAVPSGPELANPTPQLTRQLHRALFKRHKRADFDRQRERRNSRNPYFCPYKPQHHVIPREPFVLLSGTPCYESTPSGRQGQTTQIYEGTNQIQRVVIAKKLLG